MLIQDKKHPYTQLNGAVFLRINDQSVFIGGSPATLVQSIIRKIPLPTFYIFLNDRQQEQLQFLVDISSFIKQLKVICQAKDQQRLNAIFSIMGCSKWITDIQGHIGNIKIKRIGKTIALIQQNGSFQAVLKPSNIIFQTKPINIPQKIYRIKQLYDKNQINKGLCLNFKNNSVLINPPWIQSNSKIDFVIFTHRLKMLSMSSLFKNNSQIDIASTTTIFDSMHDLSQLILLNNQLRLRPLFPQKLTCLKSSSIIIYQQDNHCFSLMIRRNFNIIWYIAGRKGLQKVNWVNAKVIFLQIQVFQYIDKQKLPRDQLKKIITLGQQNQQQFEF